MCTKWHLCKQGNIYFNKGFLLKYIQGIIDQNACEIHQCFIAAPDGHINKT